MGNPFLWAQACRFDTSLQSDDWPNRMTPAQIANLHFHADESNRKTLLALLYKKADTGGLDFDDVIESYAWRGGSVSIGYATQPSILANTIRNMSRETRDKDLSNAHRPACGWAKL